MKNTDIMTVGLDVGYGLVKCMAENGRRACFESRIAPAEFIRFQVDLDGHIKPNGLILHDATEGPLWLEARPDAWRSIQQAWHRDLTYLLRSVGNTAGVRIP